MLSDRRIHFFILLGARIVGSVPSSLGVMIGVWGTCPRLGATAS